MHVESVKVFCDVARLQSFSGAAEANGVSQSAVSQIVRQLEKRLGVQLVDRSRRPLRLTQGGNAYYEGCRELVRKYLGVEAAIRKQAVQWAANVRAAAIYSVGLRDMHRYEDRFRALNPGAKVEIEYLHPDRVYHRVLEGTADFGMVSYPQESRKLVALPWREEEMVVACAPTNRLADHRSVRLSALRRQKYVHFDKRLVIRREIDRFLREHEVAVDVVMEFDNVENIKEAVEAQGGVALLPWATLQREIQARTLAAVPLAGDRLVRPLGIIHRRHPRLSQTAMRFIDLLRQPEEPAAEERPTPAGARAWSP